MLNTTHPARFPIPVKVWAILCLLLMWAGVSERVLAQAVKPGRRLLVFSKSAGFRHSSIPVGKAAIVKLGRQNGLAVDTTENAAFFTDENLKKYGAVLFLNTTGGVLDANQQAAFERFIRAGAGYVGIHAATDTDHQWPWYTALSGAWFTGHPDQDTVQTTVVSRDHISMKGFPEHWWIKDELYNFGNLNPDIKVLLTIDEKAYEGGDMGGFHPMSWYHEFDGGRSFYTAFGHREDLYTNPVYLKHLLGGIQYALKKRKIPAHFHADKSKE
jgi:cytochrome c